MNLNLIYNKRKFILLCIDFMIILISAALSFVLADIAFLIKIPIRAEINMVILLAGCVVFGFWCTKVYRNIWQYATAVIYVQMIMGMATGALI